MLKNECAIFIIKTAEKKYYLVHFFLKNNRKVIIIITYRYGFL